MDKDKIKTLTIIILGIIIFFGLINRDSKNIVAGTIRNSGNGWEIINDGTHQSININNVYVAKNRIVLEYDEFETIHSLIVTPDETMAEEGYTLGASVGVAESWIYIYDDEGNLTSPNTYNNATANIWIYGMFSK